MCCFTNICVCVEGCFWSLTRNRKNYVLNISLVSAPHLLAAVLARGASWHRGVTARTCCPPPLPTKPYTHRTRKNAFPDRIYLREKIIRFHLVAAGPPSKPDHTSFTSALKRTRAENGRRRLYRRLPPVRFRYRPILRHYRTFAGPIDFRYCFPDQTIRRVRRYSTLGERVNGDVDRVRLFLFVWRKI